MPTGGALLLETYSSNNFGLHSVVEFSNLIFPNVHTAFFRVDVLWRHPDILAACNQSCAGDGMSYHKISTV